MIHPSLCAGVAQLVEHFLAKEDVASSSLVARFRPLVPRRLQRGTARYLLPACNCSLIPKGDSADLNNNILGASSLSPDQPSTDPIK
jgi:hypothetical protein